MAYSHILRPRLLSPLIFHSMLQLVVVSCRW